MLKLLTACFVIVSCSSILLNWQSYKLESQLLETRRDLVISHNETMETLRGMEMSLHKNTLALKSITDKMEQI